MGLLLRFNSSWKNGPYQTIHQKSFKSTETYPNDRFLTEQYFILILFYPNKSWKNITKFFKTLKS